MCGSINLIRGQGPDLTRRGSAKASRHTVLGKFRDPVPHPGYLDRRNGDPTRPESNVLADDLIAAPRESVNGSGPDSGPQSVRGYTHLLCISWSEGRVTEVRGESVHRDEDFRPGHASRLPTRGRRDQFDIDGCG